MFPILPLLINTDYGETSFLIFWGHPQAGLFLARKSFTWIILATIIFAGYVNCSGQGFQSQPQPSIESLLPPTYEFGEANQVIRLQSTGSGNDLAELQDEINKVSASAGLVEIKLAARTYQLNCENPPSLCLTVTGAKQIRLSGSPGTKIVINNPRSGFMYVANMVVFEMRDLVIDYAQAPFLQGTVTRVSGSTFDVKVDTGFLDFAHPALSVDLYQSISPGSYVIDASTGRIKGDANHWISPSRESRPSYDASSGTWRVTAYNPNLAALMTVGDRYLIGSRLNTGTGWTLDSNDRVAFQNVTLHSAPHMGVFAFGNRKSLSFNRFNIRPSTGRLASTIADALHLQNNSAIVTIENSHFEGMGDDALNIYAYGARVGVLSDLSSDEVRLNAGANYTFADGDIIQFISANNGSAIYGPAGEPRVVSSRRESGSTILKLDAARPASLNPGDISFNVSQASPNSRISGNTYGSFRGQLRFHSPGGSVSGNSFADIRNQRVITTADPDFPMEGPITGLLVGKLSVPVQPDPKPPSSEPPVVNPPPAEPGTLTLHSVYRHVKTSAVQHAFSQLSSIAGYRSEGVVFKLASSVHAGTTPLYVCTRTNGFQMLSTTANCEGAGTNAGTIGHISKVRDSNFNRVIYRCYHPTYGHLATTNTGECSGNGYTNEGAMGYVN